MKKTSKVSFFLFILFYNYLWLRILVFPNLYNNFGTTGFLMWIIILLGVLIVSLILPNKLFRMNFSDQYDKSIYKWLNCFFVCLETIISICFVGYFLNKIFVDESNIYALFIMLGLAILFISNLLPNEIVDISSLFHLLGLLLIFSSLFITPKVEIEYLFMIDKVNVLFIVGTVLFIICDNFKMLINKNSLSVRKSTFVLPVVLSLLLCMVEYGLLIMTVGDKALVDISYIGFLELSFMPVTKYIGDFNFVYIYLLLICCVFKNGFNLSLIKNSLSLNKNVFNLIIVVVLIFCSIIILNSIEISMLYPYLFLIVLLNINIFWMIGKCYFVRKG